MAGRLREGHSRKREQHCKGPEALQGQGRFQHRWNPLMSQPTAIHVEHVEVTGECSLRKVMPLTFSQSTASLSPRLLTQLTALSLKPLSSLGLYDTSL